MAKQLNDGDTLDLLNGQETFMAPGDIKVLIKEKGLTQSELAKTLGIKDNHMTRVIRDIEFRKNNPQWEYSLRWLLR